jgi:hypothetical protein
VTCGIGPVPPVSVSSENRRSFRSKEQPRLRSGSRPSHLNVVLSKAALSGQSVCLRARALCPLRVSCLGADLAKSCVLLCSVRCSGPRLATGSVVPVHPAPGSRGRAARAAGLRSGGSLGQDTPTPAIPKPPCPHAGKPAPRYSGRMCLIPTIVVLSILM